MKGTVKDCKSAVIWLSCGHLVCDVYGGFLNPIMPFIAAKLGFTMAVATIIVAITQICSNMLQPVFGFSADNMLKRFFIFWGLILASIFIPLAPSAPNIYILNICMICGCLGGSFYHPQSMGYISKFSGKNCADNMGLYVSMGSVGFAIGPLLASYITQYAGLDKISYTSVFGLVLVSCMFMFIPKLSEHETKIHHKEFFKSFKEIFMNTQMQCLMLVAMLKSIVANSSCILLPFLWKTMDYSPIYIGFAIFLFVFAGAIGSFLSPKLEKIVGSKPIIYFSMLMPFPLMAGFAATYKTMPVCSLLLFSLIGFVTMLAQPVFLVWAQKLLPEYKSIVSGLVNGFCWGISALILTALGAIAQKFGILNVLLVITLVPAVFSYYVKYLKSED